MLKIKKGYSIYFFYVLVLVLNLAFFGCSKKTVEDFKGNAISKNHKPIPRKLKALDMGTAEEFAVLAYASIFSNPNSIISGKVGLMPGIREQITLDSLEVVGGATNIMASDDITSPVNLLSIAKSDMMMAYKEAASLSADSDKIDLHKNNLNEKVLSPGCYFWSGDLIINNDFIIEGNENDVWIFKVSASLLIASDVHLILSGGAKAANIFWQVSGGAVLESDVAFAGTIIAQQSVVLKNHASLTGRAFAKNGYINLDHASINLP